MLLAPLSDVACRRALPRLQHHEHEDLVFAELRRYRYRRGLVHGGMTADDAIELRARDVLAAAPDDVFLSRDEEKVTVLVALHEIAGLEPAVVECLFRLLRIAEITLHDDRRLHEELAFLVDADVAAFVVDHSAFSPRSRRIRMASDRPHASGLAQSFDRIARDPGNLGH